MVDRLGQRFGNYRLVKLLGKGGSAEVYLAEHLYLERQAAIKILHAQLLDPQTIHRFRQEARAIAHLEHPNLVRTIDFGVEDATPYLVMYYAPNGTLRQRHPRGSRLPLATIISYVSQVAAALQYAHDKYFIHRDVKPVNMLIGEHEEILLSDFGVAILPQTSPSMNKEEVAGTVSYMAPEQIQAHPQPASDQYALATVAYEWLCGALPFQGNGSEVTLKQLSTPPLSLDTWILVAPEIEEVILRALSKDPKDRFASVQDFAKALAQAAQDISFSSIFPTQTSITPIISAQTAIVPVISEYTPSAASIVAHNSSAPLVSEHASDIPLIPERIPGAPLTSDRTPSAPLASDYTSNAPAIVAHNSSAPLISDHTPSAPLILEHTPSTPFASMYPANTPLFTASAGTDWPQEQQRLPEDHESSGWPGAVMTAPVLDGPVPDFLAPTPSQALSSIQVPHTDFPEPEKRRFSRRAVLMVGGGTLIGSGLVYAAATHFFNHSAPLLSRARVTPHTVAHTTPHPFPTATVAPTPTATTKPVAKAIPSNTPRLFAVWKGLGTDQRLFWSSFNGTVWATQQQIPGQFSTVGPVLAVFGGKLYAAWRGIGSDTHIYWATFNRMAWTISQVVPQAATSASPALAVLGNKLYIAWNGPNSSSQGLSWSSFDGNAWSTPQAVSGQGSSTRPALASFDGKIYMAWKGTSTDQRLFWASFDGTTWSDAQQPNNNTPQSSDGPGLAALGNTLYLTWKGANGNQGLWWASFNGTTWTAQQEIPDVSTSTGPALTIFNGKLSMSWAGVNQAVYWSLFNGTAWSTARPLGAFSSSAGSALMVF